jgi:hypothetical protein
VADHAWLPAAEVEATLLANLLIELFWLGPEDPWQDVGAARAFDAPIRAPLAAAVARARRDGTVPIGPLREADGTVLDLRWPGAWRIASRLGAPLEHQGIGPAQLIVGLVLEAGRCTRQHGPLWERYFPGRPLDLGTAVCATLDLEDATRATALVADYLLHRMSEAFLADPDVRWPADLYPFPTDRDRARRLLALSLLRTFKAFPEMLWSYPNPHSFPYWHHALNQDVLVDTLAVVAAVWSLELDLGLATTVVPARTWRRALIDHQGPDDRTDGLQVISLPHSFSGGLGPLGET